MTSIPIGLFVGNPDGSSAANMATFKAEFDKFVALFGRRPTAMNAFTDFTQDPSQWPSNASWTAWSWAQSGAAYVGPGSGVLPVIGIPLASSAGGWGNVDTFLKDIVAGKYDADYAGIVNAWVKAGYFEFDLRFAYEFDGNFMCWSPCNSTSATRKTDFIAAWQHIYTVVHQAAAAVKATPHVVWCPATINWTGISPNDLYPGDAFVDLIGVDVYSPTYPLDLTNYDATGKATGTASDVTTWAASDTNRMHFWREQDANQWNQNGSGQGWTWAAAIAKAAAHPSKTLAICECGAGGDGGAKGPVDEAAFPTWLAAACATAGVAIRYVNIWATDQSDGKWGFLDGQKPNSAAAWKAAFGQTALPVPNVQIQLSEDAAANGSVTDAIVSITLDGQAVETVSVTAAHAQGGSQTISLTVGKGAHKLLVGFTNDFCAWVSGAYATGQAGKDRNLYLLSVTVNGVLIPASAHTFMSNGTYDVDFVV